MDLLCVCRQMTDFLHFLFITFLSCNSKNICILLFIYTHFYYSHTFLLYYSYCYIINIIFINIYVTVYRKIYTRVSKFEIEFFAAGALSMRNTPAPIIPCPSFISLERNGSVKIVINNACENLMIFMIFLMERGSILMIFIGNIIIFMACYNNNYCTIALVL